MGTDLRTAPPVTLDVPVVRALSRQVNIRAAEGEASMPTLAGHFSVFNVWYPIRSFIEGEFMERVAPGAFSKTFAENREQIKVTFNHGYDPQLGDKVLGVAETLQEDPTGARYEVPLLDTSYNRDLIPGLEVGAYGSSFRFRVMKDEWVEEPEAHEQNPNGLPERTIKEVRVFEFGPVTFPANPAATAGVRSLTDEFYERLRAQNPAEYEAVVERATLLRTPAGSTTGAADGAADGAAERTPPSLAQLRRFRDARSRLKESA